MSPGETVRSAASDMPSNVRREPKTTDPALALQVFETVNEHVRRLRQYLDQHPDPLWEPSATWSEKILAIRELFAHPDRVVPSLRQYCHLLTGVQASNYLPEQVKMHRRITKMVSRLAELDGGRLLVPGSPVLGGFGTRIGGSLHDEDTLRYYEALIGLDAAEILNEYICDKERRFIIEVGCEWGGFAYQFKTLSPNTSYILVDFPEAFLFSATYLSFLFPSSRFFFASGDKNTLDNSLLEYDFIFIPYHCLRFLNIESARATISTNAFSDMTDNQIAEIARQASRLNCLYLYVIGPRKRQKYVRESTMNLYWPHIFTLVPRENRTLKKLDFQHIAGWKRILQ